MKNILFSLVLNFVLVFNFIFPLNLQAQANNPVPPPIAEEHRWLYELLLAPNDREVQPSESFKSFYVHLFDSFAGFVHPEKIAAQNLREVFKIEGTLGYVNNVIKKRYAYDIIIMPNGERVMNVRIHLKDPVGEDFNNFQQKILTAENIWNQARVSSDFNYSFKFELVTDASTAHYSVNVFDQTRGPYDLNWGRNWSAITVSHELGHMLGIGDEYQTLSGKVDCLRHSLMCVSSSGKLMPHHFYFILRRLINPESLSHLY